MASAGPRIEYVLQAEDDIHFVGRGSVLRMNASLLVHSAGGIRLNDGPGGYAVGVRVFAMPLGLTGPRGWRVFEGRALGAPVDVPTGRRHWVSIDVRLRRVPRVPCEVVLDLVKERHYWFEEHGYAVERFSLDTVHVLRRSGVEPIAREFRAAREFARADERMTALTLTLLNSPQHPKTTPDADA